MAWKEEMGTQTETELLKEMKELTEKLNEASRAYYAQDVELMSNLEYDSLYTRDRKSVV